MSKILPLIHNDAAALDIFKFIAPSSYLFDAVLTESVDLKNNCDCWSVIDVSTSFGSLRS